MRVEDFADLASSSRGLIFKGERIKEVYCMNKRDAHHQGIFLSCDLNCEEQKCPFLVMVSDSGKEYQPAID
jgi:hypothetical protein